MIRVEEVVGRGEEVEEVLVEEDSTKGADSFCLPRQIGQCASERIEGPYPASSAARFWRDIRVPATLAAIMAAIVMLASATKSQKRDLRRPQIRPCGIIAGGAVDVFSVKMCLRNMYWAGSVTPLCGSSGDTE